MKYLRNLFLFTLLSSISALAPASAGLYFVPQTARLKPVL